MHGSREKSAKDWSPASPWIAITQNAGFPLPLSGCSRKGEKKQPHMHLYVFELRPSELPSTTASALRPAQQGRLQGSPGCGRPARCSTAFQRAPANRREGDPHSHRSSPWQFLGDTQQEVTFSDKVLLTTLSSAQIINVLAAGKLQQYLCHACYEHLSLSYD